MSTSSQHPLPPRPDWAVGLMPAPHNTSSRNHDHSVTNSRTLSPTPQRGVNGGLHINATSRQMAPQQIPSVTLQATDFPPLIALPPTQEKRAPVVSGAWANAGRPVRPPTYPANSSSLPNAQAHRHPGHSISGSNDMSLMRLEEPDRTFERPPPKVRGRW